VNRPIFLDASASGNASFYFPSIGLSLSRPMNTHPVCGQLSPPPGQPRKRSASPSFGFFSSSRRKTLGVLHFPAPFTPRMYVGHPWNPAFPPWVSGGRRGGWLFDSFCVAALVWNAAQDVDVAFLPSSPLFFTHSPSRHRPLPSPPPPVCWNAAAVRLYNRAAGSPFPFLS